MIGDKCLSDKEWYCANGWHWYIRKVISIVYISLLILWVEVSASLYLSHWFHSLLISPTPFVWVILFYTFSVFLFFLDASLFVLCCLLFINPYTSLYLHVSISPVHHQVRSIPELGLIVCRSLALHFKGIAPEEEGAEGSVGVSKLTVFMHEWLAIRTIRVHLFISWCRKGISAKG